MPEWFVVSFGGARRAPPRDCFALTPNRTSAHATPQLLQGFSAIYLAAEENHLEIAEVLLGVGGKALANIRSKDGRTAMFAAAQCDHPDMIRLLHRCGGDVELSSRNGVMPMWVGSQMGATGAVTALLELGARCDRVRPNPSDRTARDEIEAEQMEIERTARERLEKRARIEAIVADAKRAR